MKQVYVTIHLTLSVLLLSLPAWAGPGRTTYQAKIIKPDGLPLEASNINFKFTILNPAGTCILYSETFSAVNMSSTGGLISFSLGSGVKTYPVSATTFEQVFSNITSSLSCDTGGPASYSPSVNDIRKIVMQFHDGSGWQTLPAMSINAVPYAMYANEAQKLNGLTSSDFVQISTVPTCAASEALRYTGAGFSCIAVGSGSGGSVTSGSVITALGYTPADGASVTAVTSTVFSVSSTVNTLSSTVASLSATVSSLASATTIQSLNGSTSGTQSFAIGTGGTAPAFNTSNGVHTLNIPYASAGSVTAGLLSNADYIVFANKMNATSSAVISALGYTPANSATVASSQWTTSGTNIFYNTGNVGIGASSPSVRLQVVGSSINDSYILVNNNSGATYQGYFGVQDTSGGGNAAGVFVGSSSNHPFSIRTNEVDRLIIDTSGNVSVNPNKTIFAQSNVGSEAGEIELYNSTTHNMNFRKITSGNFIFSGGNVGVGTTTPVTGLDVSGGVRIGVDSTTCTPALAGTLRYNASNVEYCNGTSWQAFGVSGVGITNFNGSTSGTQLFVTGTGGTTPVFNTSNGVHTLNIPLANTGSVMAGLLSNVDYTIFTNKIASSAASIAQVLGYVPADNAASGTYAQKANNLSDLTNIATARTNLGLGVFATANTIDLGSVSATGTLAIARLPAFTGDATIAAASDTIILSNTGVTAGTYTKVTVDGKGRVTSGAQIASSDVTMALGYTPANSATITSSQWITSGTNIYYNTGNIGIGTSATAYAISLGGETARSIGVNRRTTANSNGNNLLIEAGGATSGATNRAGGNLVLSSGFSTGQGSSIIEFKTAAVSGTGAFDNTPVTRMQIDGYGNTTIMSVDPNTSGNDSPNLIINNPQTKFTFGRYGGINRFASGHGDGVTQKTLYMTGVGGIAADMGGLNIQTSTINVTTGATSRLYMNSSGNVGIGTTGPTAKLHVRQLASEQPFRMDKSDGTNIMNVDWAGRITMDTNVNSTVPMLTVGNGNFGGRLLVLNGKSSNTSNLFEAKHNSIDKFVVTYAGATGIGISNPTTTLHIVSSGTSSARGLRINSTGTGNGIFAEAQFATDAREFHIGVGGTSETTYGVPGKFYLFDNNANAMRMVVDINGNVGIGTTSLYSTFQVKTGANQNVGIEGPVGAASGSTLNIFNDTHSANVPLEIRSSATYLGLVGGSNVGIGTTTPGYKLDVNGTIRGFGITDSSDIRLKKNVMPLDLSLEKILQIEGVSYNWIDKERSAKKQIGFIAQQLEKIYPELVETDNKGMKSVNYSHLVTPLVEAVKSLYYRIVGIEERNNNQERQIASADAKIKQLEEKVAKVDKLEAENEALKTYLCSKDPAASICK